MINHLTYISDKLLAVGGGNPAGPLTTDIETLAKPLFNIQDIGLFISRIISMALIMAGILCIVFLIWGGINWMMSQGEKSKYEEARNRITSALIGLAIVAVVWLLWMIILYFLGIGTITDKGIIFNLPVASP